MLVSSFSADRKGYNSYLKSCGISKNDKNAILMFAIPYEQFISIDRLTIDQKIEIAKNESTRLHDEYILAEKEGRKSDSILALAGWDKNAKEFVRLVKIKNNI